MGDPNLSRLFEASGEMATKKQLPLRQTAQKPMLKYQPVAKQLHAYHHTDGAYSPLEGRQSYSSLSQASEIEPMVPAPFRISRTTNSVSSYRQGGQNYVSPNNIGKPTPLPKNSSNPYARPLSAKDIVNDIQHQQAQKIKKTISSSPINPGQSNSPFPVNSFMRPQSAIKKEAPITKEILTRANENRELSVGQKISQPQPPSSVPGGESSKTVQKIVSANLSTGQITTIETNGATVIQKVSPPANFSSSSQINSVITKVVENPKIIPNSQTKNMIRQVSSIPKPGSASASTSSGSHSSKTSTPELPSKVRNLNYTPTKPYSEVMTPPNEDSDESLPCRPQSGAGGNRPLQTTATAVTSTADIKVGKSALNGGTQKPSSSESDSRNNNNGSVTTMFYRKKSISGEMVHEQRPPAVGSPSKKGHGLEKVDRIEGEEDDDGYEDEDDNEELGPG